MGFVKDFLGGGAADKAAASARRGAEMTAEAQQEALDYLKEVEALPREIREEALTGLSDFYQVPDQFRSQEDLIEEARQSPLYEAILGSREAGEEAILRNASATGGLRSGGSIADLTDYNQQLENQALLESFNQARQREDYERQLHLSGLGGLAGLESYAPQIAGITAEIGRTRGQGEVAAGQIQQQGDQNFLDNLLGIGKVAIGGLQAANVGSFSDIRLKKNIQFKEYRNGFAWYEWEWIPEAREKLGLPEKDEGVLAHHVYETHPDAIGIKDGFLAVSYEKLGLERAA